MTKILTLVALTAIISSTFSNIARAVHEDIATIDSRPGVTVSFISTRPNGAARGAAILFSGGHGELRLWQGHGTRAKNFLVRSRDLFAELGVLDACQRTALSPSRPPPCPAFSYMRR